MSLKDDLTALLDKEPLLVRARFAREVEIVAEAIAKAVVVERERCAKIAEGVGCGHPEKCLSECCRITTEIARRIRAGDKP